MSKFHIKDSGEVSACKAEKGGCPFGGDENHHATAKDARETFEKRMTDETLGQPISKHAEAKAEAESFEAYEDAINEENHGYIRELQGDERKAAVAQAERILSSEYLVGKGETSKNEMELLNKSYRNQLAAIHGVPKDRVTSGEGGEDIEVDRADGGVSVYSRSNFKLKKSVDGVYQSDADRAEFNKGFYGYIQELEGEEREASAAEVESYLTSDYRSGYDEANLAYEEVTSDSSDASKAERLEAFSRMARDKRQLARAYRESLETIRGSKVTTDGYGRMSIKDGDQIIHYSADFERMGAAKESDSASYKKELSRAAGKEIGESKAFGEVKERSILVGSGFGVNPNASGMSEERFKNQEFSLLAPDGTKSKVDNAAALKFLGAN